MKSFDIQAPPAGHAAPRLGLVVLILVLQLWSRYLPSPGAVLVADDWTNLARSSFYPSHFEAAMTGLQDPNRPFSMMAVEVVYRLFGANSRYWTLLSLAANSLLLLATMKMALELTGRRGTAALTGVVFALLPNLTATYHWATQVLNEVSCALVFYALSGWMWVAYLRRGGAWRLAVSVTGYWIGLFSYEAGIFLPAAYLVLLSWKKAPVQSFLRMLPFGFIGLLYLAWRATNAFGLNQSWHYPAHMQAGISLYGMAVNIWGLAHWWGGERMLGAVLAGFQSFATISLWTRRFLFAANVGVVFLLGWGLRRLSGISNRDNVTRPFTGRQIAGFTLAWTGAAMLISVLSYTGPQLNVIPAIGVSLLAALALGRWPIRHWGPVLFLPLVLALVSNQGTAESYRQAGEFNQRLYASLQATESSWRDKNILLFDTRALRQRLAPQLLQPVGEDPATWAFYGNALLIRGFVPAGMLQLVTKSQDHGLHVLHDVENGARIEGDRLVWHDRYNPSKTHTNAMADVFVVDCLAAGQGER